MVRLGVDVGGTKIEAVLLAADGTEMLRRRVATPPGDYWGGIGAIRRLVEEMEAQAGVRAAAVGVGIPGSLSPATGLVRNANSVWLNGMPFDRDLAAALGRPVRVSNDANCFAVSEAADGAGAGAGVVFGVILGTGVGGGIVAGGRLLTGANRIAGEWGHNPLPWPEGDEVPGRPCYCGRRGCNETWLSGPGLAADHLAVTGEASSAPEIVARAAAGDAAAEATLARYEGRLARALAAVVNLLDPDVIVLGGGLGGIERLYRTLPSLLPRWCFSDRVTTPIRPPRFGDFSGVRGAAWLWDAHEAPPPAGAPVG